MGVSSKAILLIGASVLAVPVNAQTGSDAARETAAATSDATDIVVTAQRREQRLQDVPISIAVVSGDALEDRAIQNFEQLAPLVPNLTIAKTPAANLIVLRGIGSSAGSPSLDQSVVMFVDGIYAGNARQFAAPFLDIERLEVLRGPQGALVGRNTSAGAINILTRRPGDRFGGYVLGDYNFTFDGPSIEGGIDIPVTDNFAIRTVGRYADTEGYIYNDLVDQNQPTRREIVGRITGVLESGPVTMLIKYEHADIAIEGSPVQVFAPANNEFRDYRKSSRLLNGPEYDNIVTDNAVVQFDIDLGGPTLTSISGFSAFRNRNLIDADFFAGNFATADFDQDFQQLSQEIRLTSPSGGKIEYSVGAYYSVADLDEERTTGVLFAPAASTFRAFTQEDRALSLFGQLTWIVSDSLRINGSGRWTHQKKIADYLRLGGAQAATDRIGAVLADFGGRTNDSRFDPAASIQYYANRNTMFYTSFGKGSKSAGFQGAISNASAATFAYRPERSTAFEAGARLSFPGTGYLNLAAFHTTYRDLQVSAGISVPGSLAAIFFTGNAPKARVAGLEAEFLVRGGRTFQLDGSLAWLPTAKYVDFTAGPCYALQPSNGTLPGTCNQTGQRLGFTPKFSGSVNGTVTVPVGSDLQIKATLSPSFQSGNFRDFTNDPVARQDAWLKLDARISFGMVDDGWELALIGRNLTNKLTNAYSNTAGLANTFLNPAARVTVVDAPRNISVQARYKF